VSGLLDRRLLFFTGKGGVGKSTVTAATALLAADQGKRVLLVEVDAKNNLTALFEHAPVGFEPKQVHPGVFAMQMDTESSLREYLKVQAKVPVFGRIGPMARAFDFVATAAPGVKEILTVGKLAYEVREDNYDLVVVDASATGHVVGQLASPVAMAELVGVGVVRQQTAWMTDMLRDPAVTGVVIVATPEEMPVNETRVDLAAVVVNRVLPELFSREEEQVFEALRKPDTVAALEAAAGGPVAPILDAAELAVTLRRSRSEHLDRLREGMGSVPLLYAPELFTRTHGIRATSQLADALSAELGY
jgi:anion-transporting  ArsA/GET3 family ATPase